MNATTDVPAGAPAQSPAQLRESLWADGRQRLYAVLIGARVPGLRERLAKADVDNWDGLWTGELTTEERAAAPVLVTLRRRSAFTDWVLDEAAAGFPGWGALVRSPRPFLSMRSHGRALCKALLPNGQAVRIDWMDPEVMEALMPGAAPDQLQQVFADIDAMLTLQPRLWTTWRCETGRLSRQAHAVLT